MRVLRAVPRVVRMLQCTASGNGIIVAMPHSLGRPSRRGLHCFVQAVPASGQRSGVRTWMFPKDHPMALKVMKAMEEWKDDGDDAPCSWLYAMR